MATRIVLPVIDSLLIEDYQLYTTRQNKGVLRHEFVDGVNLIVGVNGLGKTTLLRLMHRVLSGPTELRAPEELGQAQREIKPIRGVHRLFADRVTDGAEKAYATLEFRIGTKQVVLRRRLDNLKIDRLTVDSKNMLEPRMNTEDFFQNWIREACGLSSFFDFLLCLRYLTFFFENRNSIVWDTNAQDELTRLFLYPLEDAQAYRLAFNEAQKADSLARNYQNILTRELDAIAETRAAKEGADDEDQDLQLLTSLRTSLERATTKREEFEERHRQLTHQSLSHEAALLEVQDQIAAERERALAALFPALEDFGALLVERMHAEASCIVCGSTDVANIESAVDRWAREHRCPCCSSSLKLPTHKRTPDLTAARSLDRLHHQRNNLRTSLDETRSRLVKVRGELNLESTTVVEIAAEIEPIQIRADAAEKRASIAIDMEKIESLRRGMAEAKRNRKRHLSTLREISEKHQTATERTIHRIAKEFDAVIENLLAEKCVLSASIDELKIGEGASDLRVLAPRFVPMMTSATSPIAVVARRTDDAVSESQRDLIDFAFRVAFLRVVMPNHPASILIDTPESSLDSVFIPRFAKLLASEGKRDADAVRRFVVTANLTGSPMIAKLLNGGGNRKLSGTQKKHILNLLDHAATSAAMRKHKSDYLVNFNKAVRGT